MKLPTSDLEHELLVHQIRTYTLINGYLTGGLLVGIAIAIYKVVGLFV